MRSVLITKEEIVARAQSLYAQYEESFQDIAASVKKLKGSMKEVGEVIEGKDDFDLDEVKPLLSHLNSQQTNLVNILKRMTELHAKMGYVIK